MNHQAPSLARGFFSRLLECTAVVSGFPVGENDGLSDELGLHVPKRAEDRRRVELHSCHGVPKSIRRLSRRCGVGSERCAGRGRGTTNECRHASARGPLATRSAASANIAARRTCREHFESSPTLSKKHAASNRGNGAKNSRRPNYTSPCSRGHRFWRQRRRSNPDCNRTRSKTRMHRDGHPVEFASRHLRL